MERLRLARDLGISYKRLHGWEPRSVQRGYDRDGQQVALADAWTIVTEVDPEWDDDERTRMRALSAYEAGICKCGFHSSLTEDKSNFFTFQEHRCPVCAASDRKGRMQDAADEQSKKAAGENPPPGTPQPGDGRTTYLRRMSPDEVAPARARRLPPTGGPRGDSP